jgi:hypothetical protein
MLVQPGPRMTPVTLTLRWITLPLVVVTLVVAGLWMFTGRAPQSEIDRRRSETNGSDVYGALATRKLLERRWTPLWGSLTVVRGARDPRDGVIVRYAKLALRKGRARWFYDPESAPREMKGNWEWADTAVAIRDRDEDGRPDEYLTPELAVADIGASEGFRPVESENAVGIKYLWDVAMSALATQLKEEGAVPSLQVE